MSIFTLKIIALISMTIDHIGFLFFPEIKLLRTIGRIAFPTYCFLIAEGFNHTKDDKNKLNNYILRLLLFALITEIPYNFMLANSVSYILEQNILFTFVSSLLMLSALNKYKKDYMLQAMIIIMFAILNMTLGLEYGLVATLFIALFYYYFQNKSKAFLIAGFPIVIFLYILSEAFISYEQLSFENIIAFLRDTNYFFFPIFLSLPFIISYKGKLGYNNKKLKYLFYIYYPLHIIILNSIHFYIK